MSYTSFFFYIFVILLLLLYYVVKPRYRYLVLLAGSAVFYYFLCKSRVICLAFGLMIAGSYLAGRILGEIRGRIKQQGLVRSVFLFMVFVCLMPLLLSKVGNLFLSCIGRESLNLWMLPIGLSFFSLQMVAYLADIYMGKIEPERNFLRYALFLSFFPQIIQGPIPRYEMLSKELFEEHRFSEEKFMGGIQLIIWGFFLKMMIADKAAVVVNTVFDSYYAYAGATLWVAAVLYSIQLYTDFLACVTLSRGVSLLFGIRLEDNFARPYFAASIKDFWRRWHISLSRWLRDYVYIPLGGSRKGKWHKYGNLLITFVISGIWHGSQLQFLAWGVLHAVYQIVGEHTVGLQKKVISALRMEWDRGLGAVIRRVGTFGFVTVAWILFRADSLKAGLVYIRNMFCVFNPWILFDNSLFKLGLSQKEWEILLPSIGILLVVSILQERKTDIRQRFDKQCIPVRWAVYLAAICGIWVFGTYGFGFDATDFIYGGF